MEINENMIEISVEVSDTACYDIMIPKVITPETYPEVMKRLKAILSIIPKVEIEESVNAPSPIMQLGLEESEDIIRLYKKTDPDVFANFLEEKYNITGKTRANITSLMGRLKKRIGGMKSAAQLHAPKDDEVQE